MTAPDELSWDALARQAADRLATGGVDNAANEARWMVEQASGMDPGGLAVEGSLPATVGGVARVDAMVERRCAGEPLQYVLGAWAFRTLDLMVDPRVLIPRPETEQVVAVALRELAAMEPEASGAGWSPLVVDLGTGSGAIALSIAAEYPTARVVATDASADALAVAAANLAGLGMAANRVELVGGSWFEALADARTLGGDGAPAGAGAVVDLIVSNPPYIAAHEQLPAEVADFEPTTALVAGPEGTEDLHTVVLGARDWLRPGGVVVVELAPHQAAGVVALAGDSGYGPVTVEPDLAGRQRMVVARWPG